MRNISRIIFTIALLLCIGQAFYYYPLLPNRVASHFGASGLPNAWSDKETFLKIYLFIVAFIGVLFSITGVVVRKLPDSMINLPNKDYWLSLGHRQETTDFLARQFHWFGSATLLLLLDIFHQSFTVNLGKAEALSHPVTSIAIYVGFSLLWSVILIVKFMRLP
ncbi:MAG TPA: DUF1648 domain-containing protein [Nitrospirota bacterium]|nr:DUF1648 domain-containing protein [Nitrospirota bacterium]